MRTIRNGVFETNSSSCHSVTLMAEADWEAVKSKELLIKRKPFDIVEHAERFNSALPNMQEEWDENVWHDYFITKQEYLQQFIDAWNSKGLDTLLEYFAKNYSPSPSDEYYSAITKWVNCNLDNEKFHRVLLGEGLGEYKDHLIVFEQPVKLIDYSSPDYNWKNGQYPTKDCYEFSSEDLWEYIHDSNLLGYLNVPEVYLYGDTDDGWLEKNAKTYCLKFKNLEGTEEIDTKQGVVIVDRKEQC